MAVRAYGQAPVALGRTHVVRGVRPVRRSFWRKTTLALRSSDSNPEDASSLSSSNGTSASSSSTKSHASVQDTGVQRGVPYTFMAALAGCGFVETSYLAASKLFSVQVACPTTGCDQVLSSPYASLFGLPLPLYGAATYGAVVLAALAAAKADAVGRAVPPPARLGVTAGVAVLATTSAVLMFVLQTALGGAPCLWCYASAALSFSLAATLLVSLPPRQLADSAAPGLGAVAVAAATLYLGLAPILSSTAPGSGDFELPYTAPAVTTDSTDTAIMLARRLRDAGARMYGAFWCSHCHEQKQAFGRQAMADFPYVECYPDGWQRGVRVADVCNAAHVQAFPTWVINGQVVEGELELQQLADALEAPLMGAPVSADALQVAAE